MHAVTNSHNLLIASGHPDPVQAWCRRDVGTLRDDSWVEGFEPLVPQLGKRQVEGVSLSMDLVAGFHNRRRVGFNLDQDVGGH
jgi:hypothetical protein